MTHKESTARSLAKTVVWRVFATFGTWLMVYLFTGEPLRSLGATLAAAAFGMVAYYIHERVWNGISWGRRHK